MLSAAHKVFPGEESHLLRRIGSSNITELVGHQKAGIGGLSAIAIVPTAAPAAIGEEAEAEETGGGSGRGVGELNHAMERLGVFGMKVLGRAAASTSEVEG